MKRKSNLIDKILTIQSRSQINNVGALSMLIFKFEGLKDEFDKTPDVIEKSINKLSSDDLLYYYPVRNVAYIQSFFRGMVSIIIDSDPKYLDNASNILSSNQKKFDFESVKALYGKKLSIGEYIAHTVSLNNLDTYYAVISELLATKFKEDIAKAIAWKQPKKGTRKVLIIKDIDKLSSCIQQNFGLRHQICHEVNVSYQNEIILEKTFVERSLNSTKQLFVASLAVLYDILYPDSPKNNVEMQEKSLEKCKTAKKKLSSAIKKLKQTITEEEYKEFSKAHNHWQKYAESWTKILTIGGGTMFYAISILTMADLIESHTKEIENISKDLSSWEGNETKPIIYK